ncbi:hypothetical protein PIB30_037750 [Stylosanthes scabra]|uniref:Uncharacterized protein n=1 Tax=Stylosanthes scabra TaxID=79078 RepID=A0ABU6TDH6_9FABA|nr:hypothetical protein [Stylosanthes scabra]
MIWSSVAQDIPNLVNKGHDGKTDQHYRRLDFGSHACTLSFIADFPEINQKSHQKILKDAKASTVDIPDVPGSTVPRMSSFSPPEGPAEIESFPHFAVLLWVRYFVRSLSASLGAVRMSQASELRKFMEKSMRETHSSILGQEGGSVSINQTKKEVLLGCKVTYDYRWSFLRFARVRVVFGEEKLNIG